uniref:RNase H type-1 domain-containing protein n=1 Tax=Gossypium raimondii TaxID=29730 RepID=A0A0D2TJV2_GOSRA|nr:hypothetical protein B456_009G052300 [Gossypium raimondii]
MVYIGVLGNHCVFQKRIENLHYRRILSENSYPRCQDCSKSHVHVARDCAFTMHLIKWEPPPTNWVKVNVDVGFSEAKQHATLGFLIRNDGLKIRSGIRTHNLVRSVVLAKAMIGFMKIILESDSKTIIKNLQATKEDYSEIRPITWDVKALTMKFSSCHFEFVAGESNAVAHAMAVEGMRRSEDSFWVEDALLKAMEMADLDRLFIWPP